MVEADLDSAHTILVVDDEPGQRRLLCQFIETLGLHCVEVESAEAMLEKLRSGLPSIVLLDVRLPGMSGIEALGPLREIAPHVPVILITAHTDLRQAISAMKSGADDYLAKPLDLDELATAIRDALGIATQGQTDRMVELPAVPDELVCHSAAMRNLLESVAIVAASDASILLTGESGVGKEVIARLIHQWSRRRSHPLVVANCAGLPESLIESELFGHVKGAFTGATSQRHGLFRTADGGTLFMDELGELPLHLQPKLLRVLESGEYTPVGSDVCCQANVRLVAATNRDLVCEIAEGRFREDLYYRVSVVEFRIPPLRERREDILPLAKRFAAEFAGGPIRFSPPANQALLLYDWSGNVRQLRNAIQRACLLCRGDVVLAEHLPAAIAKGAETSRPKADTATGSLAQVERATILAVLEECRGNRTQAAKKLGISRRTLIYKLREYD